MKKPWPNICLADVLQERNETPAPDLLVSGEIRIVEKIGFGDGAVKLRADGQTKTDMILIRPGDLVVSGINAAKGAIAVYPQDNLVPIAATIHYAAYIVNKEKADVRFLWLFLRSREFRDILLRYLPGGIKTELKAKRLLPIPIPLPPLPEQRRLIAKIDQLAAKIAGAQALRRQAAEEAEALIISNHLQLAGERTRRLGEILRLDEDAVPIKADGSYPQVGVKSFGGGLFPKSPISGTGTTYRTFNRLFEGALVLSQVKGWEGAVAVCPKNLAGWFVSPEYRTFRCVPGEARPDYLASIVLTGWFWSRLNEATRGVGARRERTRPKQFINIEIPMPDFTRQEIGARVAAEVDAMKHLQGETATALDALLPSILDKAFKGEL